MDVIELGPKQAKEVVGNEGGSYSVWDPSQFPMLIKANVSAASLSLRNNGFALPHYADSSKIAFVLQGSGIVGMIVSGKEKVVCLKKGDVIGLPLGAISWWFNKHHTELVIVFLGDTSKAHTPGVFTYFILAGTQGLLTGFSTALLSQAWDGLSEDAIKTIVGSQPEGLITKLPSHFTIPEPKEADRDGLVFNCLEATLDVDVKRGGSAVMVNSKKLSLLGQVGLAAELVRLDGRAMWAPGYSPDSGLKLSYVVKGSGRVEVVGDMGKRLLDVGVKAGDLFIVPSFCVVSMVASEDGLECFSVYTSSHEFGLTELAGTSSVWKILSPQILQAAFNVSKDVQELFSSANDSHAFIFPPK